MYPHYCVIVGRSLTVRGLSARIHEAWAYSVALSGRVAVEEEQMLAEVDQRHVVTEDIQLANGMNVFVAHPDSPGKYPTIVLLHERYGLVQHNRTSRLVSPLRGTSPSPRT